LEFHCHPFFTYKNPYLGNHQSKGLDHYRKSEFNSSKKNKIGEMSFHKNGNAIIEHKKKKAEIFLSRNNVDQSELFLGKGNISVIPNSYLSL
jgi:hypothetical protein